MAHGLCGVGPGWEQGALGTRSGHEGAAHCRESSRSTPAHCQTSLLLPVLRTYFRCSDAPRSRGVGKESANSPSCASRGETGAGFTRLRRSGRGAEPGALCKGAGPAGSGAGLGLATPGRAGCRREESEAPRGRFSQPERLSLLLRGASPHPYPQLQACHFCVPPVRGTRPGALRGVVEEDARVLALFPSCLPALARKAVGITPPKLSFAAASGGSIPL